MMTGIWYLTLAIIIAGGTLSQRVLLRLCALNWLLIPDIPLQPLDIRWVVCVYLCGKVDERIYSFYQVHYQASLESL